MTVPDFAKPWVRLAMLVLAVLLPLANGALSTRLPDEGSRPKGRALVMTILRGYPNSLALFIVLVWMMVVAPLGRIRALFKRFETVHVPIAVKPGAYDTVVRDLTDALERDGIKVTRRRAHWAYAASWQGPRALRWRHRASARPDRSSRNSWATASR